MKEGFKRSKTGDRETNEEILQSHSHLPPPESGPSQNVFFPVSFCVPGFFFFQQAKCAVIRKTCVIHKTSCRPTMG